MTREEKRVYYRMSCPRMMDDHVRRLDFIKDQVKKAKVDGVIAQRIKDGSFSKYSIGVVSLSLVFDIRQCISELSLV